MPLLADTAKRKLPQRVLAWVRPMESLARVLGSIEAREAWAHPVVSENPLTDAYTRLDDTLDGLEMLERLDDPAIFYDFTVITAHIKARTAMYLLHRAAMARPDFVPALLQWAEEEGQQQCPREAQVLLGRTRVAVALEVHERVFGAANRERVEVVTTWMQRKRAGRRPARSTNEQRSEE